MSELPYNFGVFGGNEIPNYRSRMDDITYEMLKSVKALKPGDRVEFDIKDLNTARNVQRTMKRMNRPVRVCTMEGIPYIELNNKQ